jgi:glucosamine--fructose-6-phosphate aminotransferase (isomerizing)
MPETRTAHPFHMYDAIRSQATIVERTLQRTQASRAADGMARHPRLLFVGIGTSLHAAMVASHFLRHLTAGNVCAEVEQSFELANYPLALGPDDAVCIITHTGTTQANFDVLQAAKAARAFTVAICGENCGAGMRQADVLLITCEQEASFTYTKSYTASLAVLALLALGIAERRGFPNAAPRAELDRVPELMAQSLATEGEAQNIAQQMAAHDRIALFGAGPNWATATEAALKIKESSYLVAEGFETEQLLHGPFSSLDSRTALVGLLAAGKGDDREMIILRAAGKLGMFRVAVVTPNAREGAEASHFIQVPQVSEWLSPLVHVIPLQWPAYFLAISRATNPDTGRMDQPAHARSQKHYKY